MTLLDGLDSSDVHSVFQHHGRPLSRPQLTALNAGLAQVLDDTDDDSLEQHS